MESIQVEPLSPPPDPNAGDSSSGEETEDFERCSAPVRRRRKPAKTSEKQPGKEKKRFSKDDKLVIITWLEHPSNYTKVYGTYSRRSKECSKFIVRKNCKLGLCKVPRSASVYFHSDNSCMSMHQINE
ncbi:hypothetical protein BGZ49_004598 [Haplosporangium sp. Z 27]|nr:hypothetical protein BGZ49_004598 [Haplosporangium sp. Z 27]